LDEFLGPTALKLTPVKGRAGLAAFKVQFDHLFLERFFGQREKLLIEAVAGYSLGPLALELLEDLALVQEATDHPPHQSLQMEDESGSVGLLCSHLPTVQAVVLLLVSNLVLLYYVEVIVLPVDVLLQGTVEMSKVDLLLLLQSLFFKLSQLLFELADARQLVLQASLQHLPVHHKLFVNGDELRDDLVQGHGTLGELVDRVQEALPVALEPSDLVQLQLQLILAPPPTHIILTLLLRGDYSEVRAVLDLIPLARQAARLLLQLALDVRGGVYEDVRELLDG